MKTEPKPAESTSMNVWEKERELRSWVEVEELLRRKGKGARTGGKKLAEEGEPREKEGEREKEIYQTIQINLDLKGMGHVVSSPLFLEPRTENDEGVP